MSRTVTQLAALIFAAIAFVGLASARPVQHSYQKRIVKTIGHSAYPLDGANVLYLSNDSPSGSRLVVGDDGILSTSASDELGTFGFDKCTSEFRGNVATESLIYGHVTYTNSSGTFCLTALYPYIDSTISADECSYTDDSSQMLQWWRLTRDPNDATTPSVLEFLAPIGTPFVYTALGPASGSDPVTLALSQLNEPDVLGAPFFYFGED